MEITDSRYVAEFLRGNLGLYYCNDCISEEIAIKSRRRINQIKRLLLTMPRDFDHVATCDTCGRRRNSIAFYPRL